MLFNFVLVWVYNYFDMSVTDEFDVDETLGVLNYNPGTFDNYLALQFISNFGGYFYVTVHHHNFQKC